jgi:hypothetical protein
MSGPASTSATAELIDQAGRFEATVQYATDKAEALEYALGLLRAPKAPEELSLWRAAHIELSALIRGHRDSARFYSEAAQERRLQASGLVGRPS